MDRHKENLRSTDHIVEADSPSDFALSKIGAENGSDSKSSSKTYIRSEMIPGKAGLSAMPKDYRAPSNHVIKSLLIAVVVVSVTLGLNFLFFCSLNRPPEPGMNSGLSFDYLWYVPLAVFWTFCMNQINQLLAIRYQKPAPFSSFQIAIVSLISILCLPDFTSANYHFVSRFQDPFFLLWVASQSAFYWGFAAFLEKQEEPSTRFAWKIPLLLSCCVNAYIFLSPIAPNLLSPIVWLQEQGYGLIFLFLTVLNRPPLLSKNRRAKRNIDGVESTDDGFVIPYHAFAGLEEWLNQQFKKSRDSEMSKSILKCFCLPFLLLICLGGTQISDWFENLVKVPDPADSINTANMTPAQRVEALKKFEKPEETNRTQELAEKSIFLIDSILLGVVAVSGVGILYYQSKPSHLALTSGGISFIRRRGLFKGAPKETPWNEINFIDITRPARKNSPVFDVLMFCREAKPAIRVPLRSVDTIESRDAILKAIQTYAPKACGLNARVSEALQPPTDHSYTELWLQALSAPPQRERLKPLNQGASLQDGRLHVIGTLGVGGQGQAYLAQDQDRKQEVVLKEFLLPVYVDVDVRRSALEVFENEAKILSQLQHNQIVKLIDFFIEDHRAYLVLEHIAGSNLRQLIGTDGPTMEAQALELTMQMCEILEYLHGLSPPVVHRDFSPDNLILQPDGLLKLIDFNVAKQSESTAMGSVVGKHAYLPPEQFRGQPVPQSDIYAMGATLFYLLTGQDPEAVSTSHPKEFRPDLSDVFNEIVEKATAPDLEKRYKNVAEIKVDLAKWFRA